MNKKAYQTPRTGIFKLQPETVIMDNSSTVIPVDPDENVDNSHKSNKLKERHRTIWDYQ